MHVSVVSRSPVHRHSDASLDTSTVESNDCGEIYRPDSGFLADLRPDDDLSCLNVEGEEGESSGDRTPSGSDSLRNFLDEFSDNQLRTSKMRNASIVNEAKARFGANGL